MLSRGSHSRGPKWRLYFSYWRYMVNEQSWSALLRNSRLFKSLNSIIWLLGCKGYGWLTGTWKEMVFLHYRKKSYVRKPMIFPWFLVFFPISFIPSRLHTVTCPDIRYCEKMIFAYLWKKSFLFLLNPVPNEIYVRNSRDR